MHRIIIILKKKLTPGVILTLPWGYRPIHVYDHYSQTILLVHVYLHCISHISGERLQDHWSPGLHVMFYWRFFEYILYRYKLFPHTSYPCLFGRHLRSVPVPKRIHEITYTPVLGCWYALSAYRLSIQKK